MKQTPALFLDPDRARATRRPRSSLPALPWVELLGFLMMIALTMPTAP